MKEFSLEEYLKNPSLKIVTREGKDARIICTNAKGKYPIVALIKSQNNEYPSVFTNKGKYVLHTQNPDDLFFASEKHEGWIIINKYPDGVRDTNGIIYHTKSDVSNITPVGVKRVATIKIEWEE